MVNVFLARPTGKFLGQTEILKSQSRFPGWDVLNGSSVSFGQQGTGVCVHMMEQDLGASSKGGG